MDGKRWCAYLLPAGHYDGHRLFLPGTWVKTYVEARSFSTQGVLKVVLNQRDKKSINSKINSYEFIVEKYVKVINLNDF